MGTLRRCDTGQKELLHPRHLIGRSRAAQLKLRGNEISGEHAVILWTGSTWMLQDLASRNGTWVNGRALAARECVVLRQGSKIGLARAREDWQLSDASPPSAMIVDEDTGQVRVVDGDLLALPDGDAPVATVFVDGRGRWMLELGETTIPALDGQTFHAGERYYRLILPDACHRTLDVDSRPLLLDELSLHFAVSRDEEHVRVVARHGSTDIDLDARAHHYILLTLARIRLDDAHDRIASEYAGWTAVDELARALDMDETHLNVAIYRVRKQLQAAGVVGAAGIVERRRSTRQIRIGIDDLVIDRE